MPICDACVHLLGGVGMFEKREISEILRNIVPIAYTIIRLFTVTKYKLDLNFKCNRSGYLCVVDLKLT